MSADSHTGDELSIKSFLVTSFLSYIQHNIGEVENLLKSNAAIAASEEGQL